MPVMQMPNLNDAGLLGSRVANLIDGAQLGVGSHLVNLDGAMPLAFSPAVVVVTHSPRLFDLIPNGHALFKAMIEKHASSISGIEFGYEMDSAETMIGHDKQVLKTPTSASRTPVAPAFTFREVQGNLIWNFIRLWHWLIRDPDTQISGAAQLSGGEDYDPTLLSSFAADLCVIQFDPSGRPENIVDAYCITGVWPEATGMNGVKREIGTTDIQDREISFSGVVQHNDRNKQVGRDIATMLALHKANYRNATPIATQIEDRLSDTGLTAEMANILSTFTPAG